VEKAEFEQLAKVVAAYEIPQESSLFDSHILQLTPATIYVFDA
jgi:hypothetical protein